MHWPFVGREKITMLTVKRYIHCSRIKHFTILLLLLSVASFYVNVRLDVNNQLQIDSDDYIGPECSIPPLDPFSKELVNPYKIRKPIPNIVCPGEDWVRCQYSTCKVVENRLEDMSDISCVYNDIIYKSDKEYVFGPPTEVKDDNVYTLVNSDHVKVSCRGQYSNGLEWNWTYYCTGFRNSVHQKHHVPEREESLNVLILMFDSTSRLGFVKNLPKTYNYLVNDLKGTVLKGYNIVGEGTSGALFPILTGRTEYELPDVRKDSNNNRTLDTLPFIFYSLKEHGYRTAYLEDMPWIGTFQRKYNGFQHQPTDHYLRSFFMEEAVANGRFSFLGKERYCVGDTPQYQLMLNLTKQFMHLDGKRFCLTFLADLSHDNMFLLSKADESVRNLLKTLTKNQLLDDTLVLVMGDHGPRFGKVRDTLQGRLEERFPFVCVILPAVLKRRRPEVQTALEVNANRWTTPFDVHTTLLDALDMPEYMNLYKIPGATMHRGLSFLNPIPKNRSCWHAGIAPHWCTCLAWRNVSLISPFYRKVSKALIRYINLLTDPVRSKCVVRTITAIVWVKRQRPNKVILTGKKGQIYFPKDNYQVRIVSAPGGAIYEASMAYVFHTKRFLLDIGQISRINTYSNESTCIKETRPTLNGFCYCIATKQLY